MILSVVTGIDNPILREVSRPVEKFDKSLQKLIKNMQETMLAAKGIGLAAIQVGNPIRLAVIRLNHDTDREAIFPVVNPEITYFSEEKIIAEEGCLSLPNIFGNVERARKITIDFLNKKGEKQTLKLEGLNARVVQHEIDHLNGILFTDKLVPDHPEIM